MAHYNIVLLTYLLTILFATVAAAQVKWYFEIAYPYSVDLNSSIAINITATGTFSLQQRSVNGQLILVERFLCGHMAVISA